LLVLAACKKQDNPPASPADPQHITAHASKKSTTLSMEELLQNDDNSAAEAFVAQQLKLGYGLLAALRNEDTRAEILDYAKDSPAQTVNFDAYIATSDVCLADINAELLTRDPDQTDDFNFYADIKSRMVYGDENYIPALKIMNVNTAVLDGGYYLAIGQEVSTGLDTDENHIPAWYVSSQGAVSLVLLNEYDAINESEPVIIITELQANTVEIGNTLEGISVTYRGPIGTTASSSAISVNLMHTSASISLRFEADNKSEYYEYSYYTSNTLSSGSQAYSGFPGATVPVQLASIHKNNLNQTQYFSQPAYGNGQGDWFHFISWEHDWYTSEKTVIDGFGIKFVMDGKFASEWYQLASNQNISGGWPTFGYNRTYYGRGNHVVTSY
jgi:hypothetical protein